MKLKVITPPSVEPISLTEAKKQLNVDFEDDDTFIGNLIKSAREYCEKLQNRAYVTQTLEIALDDFPCDEIELPRPPLQSVTSVKYYDVDDTENTFSSSNYYVDTYSEKGKISLNYNTYFPITTLRPKNGVIIRYIAGHGVAADVPMRIKQAILLLVAHWYENREATSQDPNISKEIMFSVRALLGLDRVVPV